MKKYLVEDSAEKLKDLIQEGKVAIAWSYYRKTKNIQINAK
jgi:hypothetical protein